MKKDILLFRLSCLSFGISSFSLLLSFNGNYSGNAIQFILAILTGVLFWAGLLVGISLIVMVNLHRKRYFSKRNKVGYRIGLLSFLSNKRAFVVDLAMIVFLIAFIAAMFIPLINQDVVLIIFTFLLFSIYMHCMLNGVNYKYIKSISKECRK